MRSRIYLTDQDGAVYGLGPCHGFALLPAQAAYNPILGRATRLGSYPLEVQFRGGTERFHVPNGAAYYRPGGFPEFDLFSAHRNNPPEPESWQVVLFDAADEGMNWSGRTRNNCELIAKGTAIAQAAPVDGGMEGFRLRPGDRIWTAYVSGAAVDVDLYTQALDGTWYLAEDDVVAATETRPVVLTREVRGAIGRIYLRASGAGGTYHVDLEQEAG